jgi:group I intron endonuclease
MTNDEDAKKMGRIYGLIDPRTNVVRYIGYTKHSIEKRCREHLFPSSLISDTYKNHWIKSLLSVGLKPLPITIEEINHEDRVGREQFWIEFYKSKDLTNGTAGGDGMIDPSDYTREKMSKSKLGTKRPPDVCQRISKGGRGRIFTQNARDKISKKLNGRMGPFLQGKHHNVSKTSKYVGVSFIKTSKKWAAHIMYNRKAYHLGTFEKEEDAARAYNKKALEFFGDNARLNIIEEDDNNEQF